MTEQNEIMPKLRNLRAAVEASSRSAAASFERRAAVLETGEIDQTVAAFNVFATGGDATTRSNAGKLKWKGSVGEDGMNNGVPLTRVLLDDVPNGFDTDGPATRLGELDANDRLLVVGHGSYGDDPKLGSKSPQQLAQFLHDKGLRQAKTVSLVSCNSGWGWGNISLVASFGYTSAAKLPFGKVFADEMGQLGIHSEIVARVGFVTVLQSGRKRVEPVDWLYAGAVVVPKGWNKRKWNS